MQPETIHRAARGAGWNLWLLCPLTAALSAAALAASAAAPASATASATASSAAYSPAAVAASYRVIPLSSSVLSADINASGQVAFTEFGAGGNTRAKFYDGASVRDLGTFGGPGAFTAALNDHGQVTGAAQVDAAGEVIHAFRWSKTAGLVDLNRPGMGLSAGIAINNRGWVAGVAAFSTGGPFHAFRWTPNAGIVDLGSFGQSSAAQAINDAGTVVGDSEAPAGGIFGLPFRWTEAGGLQALSNIPSVASQALDINEAGKIVGSAAFDASLNDRAFLWTREQGLLPIAPPAVLSFARRINEHGLVIGQIFDVPIESNGFIWSRETGFLRFGTGPADTSYAGDVNNRGQVVGGINGRAVAWTRAQGFVDLNTRIPGAPPGLELWQGEGINDSGTIAAIANTGLVLLVPNAAYNQAPVAGPVKLTGTPRAGALLSFAAGFTDVDVRDTHKATWSWGDGSKTTGTVSEKNGVGNVSAQHSYRASGIYTVTLTVSDSGGKSSTVQRTVAVCGAGASIAGEGFFGAPGLSAQAAHNIPVGSFAFVSSANAAQRGTAAVHVNVAGMALRSTQVDAIGVTTDGTRVQYSGRGTVNGSGSYRFTLTAIAGAKSGGQDRLMVRIWHMEPGTKAEVVDYDNGGGKHKAAAGGEGAAVFKESRIEIGAQ